MDMDDTDSTARERGVELTLGVITIGQTPRTDLTPELQQLLPGAHLVERGVLDRLSRAQIDELAPRAGDHALTTRLADGTSAVIGESAVTDRLPGILRRLEAEVDGVLLACTGRFPELPHRKPLFVPDRIIAHAVAAAAPSTAPVGVIAPLPEQITDTTAKFEDALRGRSPVLVTTCSPYTGGERDLRDAARELAARGAALIAMDCFGYTAAMRRHVHEETGLPVIVARSVAARLAAETLGLDGDSA